MKRLLFFVVPAACFVILGGCAGSRLPVDATPEQIQAADCADKAEWLSKARMGMAVGSLFVSAADMREYRKALAQIEAEVARGCK